MVPSAYFFFVEAFAFGGGVLAAGAFTAGLAAAVAFAGVAFFAAIVAAPIKRLRADTGFNVTRNPREEKTRRRVYLRLRVQLLP